MGDHQNDAGRLGSNQRLTRRQLLAAAGLLGIGGGIAALTGCSSGPAAPAPQASKPAAPTAEPAKPGAAAAPATSAPAAQTKPTTQGGTLVVAGEAVGENYVPAVTFQGWAHAWVLCGIYESLYTSRDFKTLIPALATGHSVSGDGLVYTFQLRKGVKFHDGTPFNAEAVEFNYMRYLDKNHPYYEASAIYRTAMLPNIKTIKAKDEYTVDFTLEKPTVSFLAALTMVYAGIMSPTAIKKYGAQDAGRYPVGTGPFVFEKAEKGNQASFKVFNEYRGGRPPLDRIVVRAIPDDQAMTAALLSGEVDVTSFIDYKDLDTFRKHPNLKVQAVKAASTGYIVTNQVHTAMKDVRVRRAVAHAINKQKIIDVIFYGEADIPAGWIPPAVLGYAPQFNDYYKYDVQKAKDLLKEAGAAPEFVLYAQNSGFWPRMAELVQADLNAAGFKVTIEKTDPGKFYGQMTEGQHAAYLGDATYNVPDPDEQFWGHYGCDNPRAKRIGHCDPAFDDLLAKQAAQMDWEKRKQMLWDLQKMQLDTVAHAPLYNYRFMTVSNKRVEGYEPMPVRLMFLDKTYVTKN